MRWLTALRAAMCRQRKAGKMVLLVGDLNMKSRTVDTHWRFRSVNVPRLLQSAAAATDAEEDATLRSALHKVGAEWPRTRAALAAKVVQPYKTKNSKNGDEFDKFRAMVLDKDGRLVQLGWPEKDQRDAERSFAVDGMGIDDDGTVVLGEPSERCAFVYQEPDTLCARELAEALKKVAGVELCEKEQRCLAELRLPASPHGGNRSGAPDGMKRFLEDDGMIDVFAELHADAKERYTCWEQYTNKVWKCTQKASLSSHPVFPS
jgi:hypothetical protein